MVKQPKCLICPAVLVDKPVQHGRVAVYGKIQIAVTVRILVGRDIRLLCPIVVTARKTPVIILALQAVCQNIGHPVVAELVKDAFGTVTFQIHSVKTPANRFFDGILAGDIFLVACLPII